MDTSTVESSIVRGSKILYTIFISYLKTEIQEEVSV